MRSKNAPGHASRTQQARRADIVEAAVVVIDRDGYSAATIDLIAVEAGTTKGTVLYHFSTKEAVHEAVVAALFERGTAYMTEQIMAVGSARARLAAYLRSNLHFIVEHAPHVRAVHRILQDSSVRVDDPTAVPGTRRLLEAGQRTGELGSFDPEAVALAIRAVVDGAAFHLTAHPDLDVHHYIEQIVLLFDRATAPQTTRSI